MAQAYDDEELSISLSPSQIRRNRPPGDDGQQPHDDDNARHQQHGRHRQHHPHQQPPTAGPSIDAAVMSSGPPALDGQHAPLPLRAEKARTEQRIGAYSIVKTLGEGSFGKVKLAVHRGTGQQVALKIISRKNLISRDMQGRVEREIEYLQLLRHPHIIKLYVFWGVLLNGMRPQLTFTT
jgi:carbon catabolite-derepressing protein kinase